MVVEYEDVVVPKWLESLDKEILQEWEDYFMSDNAEWYNE